MKIEIHLNGPQTVAWLKSVLDSYAEAAQADRDAQDAKFNEQWERAAEAAAKAEVEPAPVEAEKPKRASRKKAEEPEPKPEPAAQITTNPEDRKPVDEIPEAEVVESTPVDDLFEDDAPAKVYTREDVKDAMKAYQAKHGLEMLAANAGTLLGAAKLSAIPDDPAAFEAAVKRLEAATNA